MLMQVLFNIHIEEDAGRFTTDDVTDHVVRKLIYRHPHVFGDVSVKDSGEVLANWEQLKRAEKGQKTTADALDAVARSLPALWRADKLLKRAGLTEDVPEELRGAWDAMREAAAENRRAEEALNRACDALVEAFRAYESKGEVK